MPHQCVKCGELYQDDDSQILEGCECGASMFFYIKEEKYEKLKEEEEMDLSEEERAQIEKDVYEIIGEEIDKDKPIVLDLETVNILKPGKYELNLVNLFKEEGPFVYKLEDGKYVVDLAGGFEEFEEVE